jgi:hypothetical protein
MVEAAVRSSASGSPIRIADVLTTAHTEALETTPPGQLHDVLNSWSSIHQVVGLPEKD